MSDPSPCPDPTGCTWETRTIRGVTVKACARCGQIRMDPNDLASLVDAPATARPPSTATETTGYAPAPVTRVDPVGPRPTRTSAPTIMPDLDDDDEDSVEAPLPSRPRSDRPAASASSPPPRAPTPPPSGRRPPSQSATAAPPTPAPDRFRAAPPQPVAKAPAHLRHTRTWTDDDPEEPTRVDSSLTGDDKARPALDDSRAPTEEATPLAGLHTGSDEGPGLSLGAAVTRHDEPELGFAAADDGLLEDPTEEEQRFFTDEQPRPEPALFADRGLDHDPEGLFDDDPPPRRRGGGLLVGFGLIAALLILVGLVAAVFLVPELRSIVGLATSEPIAEVEPVAETELGDPIAAPDATGPPDAPATGDGGEDSADGAATEPTADPDTAATEADTTTPAAPREAAASDDTAADAPPDATDPATAGAGTAEPAPDASAPEAPPTPRPTATAPAYGALIDQGWSAVESNPSAAADAFRAAIKMRKDDAEANYGLGYAMLKQDHRNGARAYLCKAADLAEPDTRQEILGILANAKLACER